MVRAVIRLSEGCVAETARERPVSVWLNCGCIGISCSRLNGDLGRFGRVVQSLSKMDAPLVMGTMVPLSERGGTVIARKWFGPGVKQQVSLQAAGVAERFTTYEAHVITANQTLTHEHVIKVAVVPKDALLAVFAGKHSLARVDIDVIDQGFESGVRNRAFRTWREQVALSCHVLVQLYN